MHLQQDPYLGRCSSLRLRSCSSPPSNPGAKLLSLLYRNYYDSSSRIRDSLALSLSSSNSAARKVQLK